MEHQVGWRWVKSPWESFLFLHLSSHHSLLLTHWGSSHWPPFSSLHWRITQAPSWWILHPSETFLNFTSLHPFPTSQLTPCLPYLKKKKYSSSPRSCPQESVGLSFVPVGQCFFHTALSCDQRSHSQLDLGAGGGKQTGPLWSASDMKTGCHIWFENQFSF